MESQQRQRTQAKFVTFIVPVFVIMIYFLLQGEQGDVVNISRDEQYIYISLGEYGSFQIYEMRNSRPQPNRGVLAPSVETLKKIHFYNSPLEKSQKIVRNPFSEIKIQYGDVLQTVVKDKTLYVINPNQGLVIFDIANRQMPEEIARYKFFGIRNLVFFENLAFAAAGSEGVYILDLTEPKDIQVLGHYDTAGTAEAIYPAFMNFGEMDILSDQVNKPVEEQKTQQYLAFVADGEEGYLILDFKTGERIFREMTLLRAENTPGYVNGIYFRDSYLFLADSESGVRVFDIFSGGFDPTKPRYLGVIETPGSAYQVIYHRNEIYIADGKAGLWIFGLNPLSQSQPFFKLSDLQFAGEISSLAISKDLAIIGAGQLGVYLIDISNPANPIQINHLQTPGLSSIPQIFNALVGRTTWSSKVTDSIWDMTKEIIFGLIILFGVVLVLSLFVLPTASFKEALASVGTFGSYLFGKVGPTVLVESGELQTNPFIQDHSKIRPLILDQASAGLVQDRHGNLRLADPGPSRLEPGEALVKIIDLRPRTFIFGPAEENPFEPRQENEDEIMARHRARRRIETQAFTHDGVEIVPNIIVDFRVKTDPNPNSSGYAYYAPYAFQALRKEYAVDKSFGEGQQSHSLNRLTGELAVKAWREYLQYFTLENLFLPLDGTDGFTGSKSIFGLEFVVESVNQFLTQQFVDEVGPDGQKTGQKVFSEAYNELEQAGLEVLKVWIVNPRIAPEDAQIFLDRSLGEWPEKILDFQLQVQAKYSEIDAENRQRALVEFSKLSIQSLAEGLQRYQNLPENYLYMNRSLYLLLRGTRSSSKIDPIEKMQIDQLLEWLEGHLET